MKQEASLLDEIEVRRAQVGPRAMKDPASREYAIQTLYSLKMYLESKEIDERRLREELEVIKEHKHWKVLGYDTLDAYLKTETGLTAAEILGRAKQAVIKAVCAAAREAGPIQPKGGDRRSEDAENQCDNNHIDRKHGSTDPTYLARKLLTQDPDGFALLEAGEFRSVRAAAKHFGIVKDKPTKAVSIESPEAALSALRKVFSDDAITAALRAEQEYDPSPDEESEDRFFRLIVNLSVSDRLDLLYYLMHSTEAIPSDFYKGTEIAQQAFLALEPDEALTFMEWANNQAWSSAA